MTPQEYFDNFISTQDKDSFCSYCDTHTTQEIMSYYEIPFKRTFKRIVDYYGYDLKSRNPMKGRKSTCSHESYLERGKRSSLKQKSDWENKSDIERQEWSSKQKQAHSSQEFRETISKINKDYLSNLSDDEKVRLNQKRSNTMKEWWDSLSVEEKQREIDKHIEGGAGWNYDKIKETVKNKYGVENISQLAPIKQQAKESTIKTCREKYGVDYNCLLPQCNVGSKGNGTRPNNDFENLLKENINDYISELGTTKEFPLEKYKYDFKVGNTLIEINPSATHNSTWGIHSKKGLDKMYHIQKTLCANKYGYRCIHIFDWDDPNKVISLLNKKETVYARECFVKEVEFDCAINFINTYHLQNYAKDKVRLGLYYNNELVSIMTFGKPRYNRKYDWELIRYCSSKNVIGGSEKLFKYFLDNYNGSIISYCDNSKFDGNTYNKLGFQLIRQGKPSKHWYNIKDKIHITDNLLRQVGFDRLFGTNFGKGISNDELIKSCGFVEIYDCGQSTYIYKRD